MAVFFVLQYDDIIASILRLTRENGSDIRQVVRAKQFLLKLPAIRSWLDFSQKLSSRLGRTHSLSPESRLGVLLIWFVSQVQHKLHLSTNKRARDLLILLQTGPAN